MGTPKPGWGNPPDGMVPAVRFFPSARAAAAYQILVWGEDEPAEHKAYVEHLKATTKNEHGSGWAIVGYQSIVVIAEGVKKAADSDKVAKALEGITFDTPVGKRTFNAKTQETEAGEFWSEMVKDPKVPFSVMKKAEYIDPTPLLEVSALCRSRLLRGCAPLQWLLFYGVIASEAKQTR